MHVLFAATTETAAQSGLFGALGIDWRTLLLNGVAFLIIVWVLSKFVYPILVKALDAKQSELEAAARGQREAEERLHAAEQSAAKIVGEARSSAREIVTSAKHEAQEMVKATEDKAKAQSERIAAEAREQIARDVEAARRELRSETAKLVVNATERVLGEKLDAGADARLVARSLGEKQ